MRDFDSPWKDAFAFFLEAFLDLFLPRVGAAIDWSRGYESLDKELQSIVPNAELGKHYVDKLMKVWLHEGGETWILIHIEVQAQREKGFAERMFNYYCRLRSQYKRKIMSLAVLADNNPSWHPKLFTEEFFGNRVAFEIMTIKLLDWMSRQEELEASANPFAPLVLAHLQALATRKDPEQRLSWKIRFVKSLYGHGWDEKQVRELFRLVDWLMKLPEELESEFWEEISAYEKEKAMPFVTTPERLALKKGREEGRQEGRVETLRKTIRVLLEKRFKGVPQEDMRILESLTDPDLLEKIHDEAITAPGIESLRSLWTGR